MQIGTGAHYHMPAQKYKRDVIPGLAGPFSTAFSPIALIPRLRLASTFLLQAFERSQTLLQATR